MSRIPGFSDYFHGRRPSRDELIKFLKAHGMPLGELEGDDSHRILCIGTDRNLVDQLKELLPPEDGYKLETANNGFEAGFHAETLHPQTFVIDFALGRMESPTIYER